MLMIFKMVSKTLGLPSGAPVFLGKEKTGEVKITIIDYGRDKFHEKQKKG